MKCSSRLLCGLLMSCLTFKGSHEQVFVNQSPSSITATEGESARISCCWNKTEAKYQLKVAWYKNEERIAGERLKQTSTALNCSVLNISNLAGEDTGDYVCKVIEDIPYLTEYVGIKTSLTVTQIQQSTTQATTQGSSSPSVQTSQVTVTISPTSPTSPPDSSLILPLSLVAAIGLLTLCLAFSLCKMRNSCKNTDRVVIHQMPHSNGEEHENMEEEEGSTGSSRGSLQWYQVPVYWSYFDLQRGEEQ